MNLIEGLAIFLFLLCHPTGNDSLGAICAGDSGLTQCDVPILTPAQVISIDRGRVEAMREKMMNTTGVRRPIYASDGDPALTMPLINFTDAQLSMVRRLYRYNMEPQEIVSRRRKRQAAGVEEACLGNGIERVLFALAPNNDFLQVEGAFQSSNGCSQQGRPTGCMGECCEEEIPVSVFCYNVDQRTWGTFELILTRCTCCES